MLDTMTMTKVVGAFCGALLVYLLGSWVGEALYHGGGHHATEQAYLIDTGEDEAPADGGAEEVPLLAMVRDGDPGAGERVFRQCQACHKIDAEQNGAGPHLVNILGRDIASVAGFNYSGALPAGEWGVDNLDPWLENPSGFASGTSMAYNGVKKREDRANLIAYMASMTEGYTLPEGEAAPVDEAAAPAEEPATETAEAAEADAPEATQEAMADQANIDAEAATESPVDTTAAASAMESSGEEAAEAATAELAEVAEAEPAAPEAAETPETAEAAAPEAVQTAEADTAATETAEAEAPAELAGGDVSPIAAAYENADIEEGKKVYRQCQACHVADKEQNRVGPHLVGLLGRPQHAVEGFRYSGALPDGEWTLEALDAWLENPREYANGTSMSFRGLSDVQDRANVIAYIESLN